MVILLTHRQLAFLGTLFKEDPPLGFYIAPVFMPKTQQPSVTGRRTSRPLGEYCTASGQPFLSKAAWPPGCGRRLQIGLASVTRAQITHEGTLWAVVPPSTLLPSRKRHFWSQGFLDSPLIRWRAGYNTSGPYSPCSPGPVQSYTLMSFVMTLDI